MLYYKTQPNPAQQYSDLIIKQWIFFLEKVNMLLNKEIKPNNLACIQYEKLVWVLLHISRWLKIFIILTEYLLSPTWTYQVKIQNQLYLSGYCNSIFCQYIWLVTIEPITEANEQSCSLYVDLEMKNERLRI